MRHLEIRNARGMSTRAIIDALLAAGFSLPSGGYSITATQVRDVTFSQWHEDDCTFSQFETDEDRMEFEKHIARSTKKLLVAVEIASVRKQLEDADREMVRRYLADRWAQIVGDYKKTLAHDEADEPVVVGG